MEGTGKKYGGDV